MTAAAKYAPSNPFDPGTYGAEYFERIKDKPLAWLKRADAAIDRELAYSVKAEIERMTRSHAVNVAIMRAEAKGGAK